ncbi:MAG: aldehyde dehydrogenase [Tenacibaculum sp.]
MKIQNYINGKFTLPVNNRWIDNYNPSKAEVYGQIPDSTAEDVNLAVWAAQKAFPSWSNTTLEQRSAILFKIAQGIEDKLMFLAKAEVKDNGKPLSLAVKIDLPRAVTNFRFFASALTQFSSEAHESTGLNAINFTLRQPIGVAACISPWNLPLYLFTWKIAPALAAGNCVIAKPSEISPVTAYLLAKICHKAGLPKGVLNIIHGRGATAGQAIVAHPKIKAISFTGGTATGIQIAKTAAPMFKKLSLELGGKNPNIIFADCNYKKMLHTTLFSSFTNQGQLCLCGSRIFVEEIIYEQFKSDFIKKVSELKVGNPFDQGTNLGALVSETHLKKVQSHIDLAHAEGGKILYGGNKLVVKNCEKGYFLQPTIIEVSNNNCQLNQEEVFGPVVSLMPFKQEDEVLQMANAVKFGLSASLWTQDINRSLRMSKQLEVGIVWVNTWLFRDLRTPFGGVKKSGLGREGGFEALRFFTEAKNICIKY